MGARGYLLVFRTMKKPDLHAHYSGHWMVFGKINELINEKHTASEKAERFELALGNRAGLLRVIY